MVDMSQTALKPSEVSEIVNGLDFELEENQPWKAEGDRRETSTMLQEVAELKERYKREGLATTKSLFCESFARGMAVDHIYNSSVCGSVGTQTYGDTQSAVDDFFAKKDEGELTSTSVKETKNMCRALEKMHGFHTEMDGSGLLIVDQILSVHKLVMDGLHEDAGKLRIKTAYTRTEEGRYVYPCHDLVENLLYTVIDHHNLHMEALKKKVEDGNMTTLEKVLYVIKCAAWLLFNFVYVHPFGNGNGRLCRLMANYVLSLIAPFPISVYCDRPSKRGRDDYLQAIVTCRKNPREGPRQLATMLLEGVWEGWKSFFENINSWNAKNTPSILIQKSKAAQHLEERVTRVVRRDSSVDVKEAIRAVQKAVDAVDTTPLEATQSMHKYIAISGKQIKTILVAVFP